MLSVLPIVHPGTSPRLEVWSRLDSTRNFSCGKITRNLPRIAQFHLRLQGVLRCSGASVEVFCRVQLHVGRGGDLATSQSLLEAGRAAAMALDDEKNLESAAASVVP